jgi:hypothetical protein
MPTTAARAAAEAPEAAVASRHIDFNAYLRSTLILLKPVINKSGQCCMLAELIPRCCGLDAWLFLDVKCIGTALAYVCDALLFTLSGSPTPCVCTHTQVESKAQVAKRRREAQQEFLYTIPVTPQVGGSSSSSSSSSGSSGSRACGDVLVLWPVGHYSKIHTGQCVGHGHNNCNGRLCQVWVQCITSPCMCCVLCCAVLCRAVPCRAVPCRAVPCRAVPCRAVPCRAVPCRAVLCCAVLCCAVLCCAVLCCAVLCFVLRLVSPWTCSTTLT